MAYEGQQIKITLPAQQDLSTKQFYFVKVNTSGNADVCAAVTDKPIGVLVNKPAAAGDACEIVTLGVCKVSGDANLTKGDEIGTSADGQAAVYTVSDTTKYIVGTVLEDNSTAGGLVTAYINCSPGRTNIA